MASTHLLTLEGWKANGATAISAAATTTVGLYFDCLTISCPHRAEA